jgi:hypothetical protein
VLYNGGCPVTTTTASRPPNDSHAVNDADRIAWTQNLRQVPHLHKFVTASLLLWCCSRLQSVRSQMFWFANQTLRWCSCLSIQCTYAVHWQMVAGEAVAEANGPITNTAACRLVCFPLSLDITHLGKVSSDHELRKNSYISNLHITTTHYPATVGRNTANRHDRLVRCCTVLREHP